MGVDSGVEAEILAAIDAEVFTSPRLPKRGPVEAPQDALPCPRRPGHLRAYQSAAPLKRHRFGDELRQLVSSPRLPKRGPVEAGRVTIE